MDTEMTAAAAAMVTIVTEPENLSRMMFSFRLAVCDCNGVPPMNSADGNDFRHWLIACVRDAFCGYGWRLRKCGSTSKPDCIWARAKRDQPNCRQPAAAVPAGTRTKCEDIYRIAAMQRFVVSQNTSL